MNFSSKNLSSRAILKTDLQNRVKYNVRGLLETFLGTHLVSNSTVERCVRELNKKCTKHFDNLEELAEKDGDQEKKMYGPLLAIFRVIEESCSYDPRSFHRQVVSSHSKKFDDEGQNLPSSQPDFVFMETSPTQVSHIGDGSRPLRRRVSSFIEVKAKEGDRPQPSKQQELMKDVTAQAADYAGLILMSRPFHLFAIGMVIFGTKFSVGYFDHAGILFSPEYEIKGNMDILVRVIRRLTCDMSLFDLGHDQLVTLMDNGTYYQPEYPRFKVRLGTNDTRYWITHGLPLWVSHSLFGRGTSVWRVTIKNNGRERAILKVAWRAQTRRAESDIYGDIKVLGGHPGIAKFIDGGDARYPLGNIVNINALRNPNVSDGNYDHSVEDNPILHRVIINSMGRGLRTYKSELELVQSLRAALAGHKFLVEHGILHRDISAGNIFIWDSEMNGFPPPKGQEGFLADVELASVRPPSTVLKMIPAPISPGPYPIPLPPMNPSGIRNAHLRPTRHTFEEVPGPAKSSHGPQMTGTAQFMATELLRAAIEGKTISREVHHDLESFVWVIFYAIYKHTVLDLQLDLTLHHEVAEEFKNYFGGSTLNEIILHRSAAQNDQDMLRACHPPDGVVVFLLEECSQMLLEQNPPHSLQRATPNMFRDIKASRGYSTRSEQSTQTFITYEALETTLEIVLEGLGVRA